MATTGSPRRPAPAPEQRTPPATTPARKPARRKRKARSPFWRAVATIFNFFGIVVLLCIIAVMIWLYGQIRSAPKQIDINFNPPGRTVILSSDGVPLAALFTENRKQVALDKIPKDLQNATISLEDRRFWTRTTAIDPQGILRALTRNVRHGDLHGEGASTLTQQLARNLGAGGLTRNKSFSRKVHEWIVANQMEKTFTKSDILEMYLNDVYYGSGAYGVEAAAETYFGKDVSQLDLAQCALLAGLPNQPSTFNPYRNKQAAEQQRNIVLDQMLAQGHITPSQCAKAKAEYIHLASPHAPRRGSRVYHAPYFVAFVVDRLKQDLGESYLMNGNLQVTTTLNWEMQQKAEEIVRRHIAESPRGGPTQAALVAIDHHTGEIKALVGGVDFNKSQYNMVTQARRQPGSLFKAVVYSAAIDSGVVSEDTRVYDGPQSYPSASGLWTPKDDDGYSYRSRTIRDAMAWSVNVVAVKVLHEIGPATAVKYARLMGIDADTPLDPVLSLALGSSAVSPLEMATVYATIANGGNRPTPIAYTHVQDDDGKTILDIAPTVVPHVIGTEAAGELDDMLHAVCQYGTGARAGSLIPGAHGKTGTTQGHKDTWFIGYTPDLTCAIWAGHPIYGARGPQYGVEMTGTSWGATVCVPMWTDFMQAVQPILKKLQLKNGGHPKAVIQVKPGSGDHPGYTTPDTVDIPARSRHNAPSDTSGVVDNGDGTVTVTIDSNSQLLAPPGSPGSERRVFTKGSEPTQWAPQYTPGTTSSPAAPTPAAPSGDGSSSATGQSAGQDSGADDSADTSDHDSEVVTPAPSSSAAPAPRPRAPDVAAAAPPPPPRRIEYVTVRVNPEDNLLATRWTPEVVEKRFVKGTEPHKYSTMYGPPPGEH